jgi:hypothetical protein
LHNVFVSRKDNRIEMRVDNDVEILSAEIKPIDSAQIGSNNLFIAGISDAFKTKLISNEKLENFEGCIVQLLYNNRQIDLSQATSRSQTNIKASKCYKSSLYRSSSPAPNINNGPVKLVLNRYSSSKQQNKYDFSSLLNEECSLSKNYDTSHLKVKFRKRKNLFFLDLMI